MARVDPETGCIVIRLVYDGPAWAGKTTSLRGLARTLGTEIFSGDEADGRTLHLDWVDYVGGLFEGRPIRCQIVGVPGQRVLERRRKMILETADAVVFVADSRTGQIGENRRSFELLRTITVSASPPVAIVVQANKRDLAGVMALDELREALGGGAALAVTEAVAERDEGIRETFILAVRLALDRVRALLDGGMLPHAKPEIGSGQDLLAALLAAEGDGADPASPIGLEHRAAMPAGHGMAALAAAHADDPQGGGGPRRPRTPDSSVPIGLVWPPVEGRVTVHEATRGEIVRQRAASGDWEGRAGEFQFMSPLPALFFDLEEGRRALIGWSRWHAMAGSRLSPARAIVLAVAAPGAWRLWQIVRTLPTLRDLCRDLVKQGDRAAGEGLFRVIDLRLRAQRDLVASGWLAGVDLDLIGTSEVGEPIYTGMAPFPAEAPRAVAAAALDEVRLVEEELVPALRTELALTPARLAGVLAGVQLAAAAKERRHIAEAIRRALLRD